MIVSLDYKEGDLGVYFPVGGRLSTEFAEANNLLRKKDENGNNIGGFIEPGKQNIKAIRLRGEPSDGLFLSLDSLAPFTDISKLKEGDSITVLNGTLICEKYIPKSNHKRSQNKTTIPKKKINKIKYPYFEEHIDTKQLAYYLDIFRPGDLCTITLKMHGTSGRTSNTIQQRISKSLVRRVLHRPVKVKTSWGTVSGSRRVVLNFDRGIGDGYYTDSSFRQKCHDIIAPRLHKGEEVFYEIVGWADENSLIMPEGKNSKVGDPEFIKRYGDTTRFTYACEDGECDFYIYRITKTDEDGFTVEYPDWLMRIRAEQMGLKCVPLLDQFFYTTQEDLLERVNQFVDGPDPVGKIHIREGVVVRIQNREKFTAVKAKNFNFKVLEDIIKDTAKAPDMEEAQEVGSLIDEDNKQ